MHHPAIRLTRILAFALILILILLPSTAQCAASADSVYGTWDLTNVRTDPQVLGLYDSFTLTDDGTYTRTTAGNTSSGTWTKSGDTLQLVSSHGTESFTLKNQMLILEQNDMVLYYTVSAGNANSMTGTWTLTDSLTPLSLWQIGPQSFHFERNGRCTVTESGFSYQADWTLQGNSIYLDGDAKLTIGAGCLIRERPLLNIGGAGFSEGMLYLIFSKREIPPVQGDADGSGIADLNDLLLILQHCAGWSVTLDPNLSDLNDDGNCTLADALMLLESMIP